jgi:hypothetical protein
MVSGKDAEGLKIEVKLSGVPANALMHPPSL